MQPRTLSQAETVLAGRSILVTGHTGFCGGWLTLWLDAIGCRVSGISLPPETSPNLFEAAGIADIAESRLIDIRDQAALTRAMQDIRPDAVMHLAAQPLVRRSYREPVETFSTNVQGTVNVLEAARNAGVRAVVAVTTDKVYRNHEAGRAFVETDELGGHDPYSASKAAAEMVIQSYQSSFGSELAIAAARGGNIIGGGDWSEDRLVPDAVRAIMASRELELRNPASTRPWQHVLALCHGYIQLCAALLADPSSVAPAYNFGPSTDDNLTVGEVVDLFYGAWRQMPLSIRPSPLHEAGLLSVDSTLARQALGWQPGLDTALSVQWTAQWYAAACDRAEDQVALTRDQIERYRARVSRLTA